VIESAVVGRPDPDMGTIVNAFVVLRPGATADDAARESIRAHVKKHLATYKTPRRIDWIDHLPRNPSGKLQHFILRRRVEAEAAADLERAKPERER